MRGFNLSKFKSQKGATGVDIVVSITVIAITIAVVTAIYTNVDLTSKRVQRTAGATRIATSILEQIDKMYYEKFLDEINRLHSIAASEEYVDSIIGKDEFIIYPKKTALDVRIFNTKIPKGYTVNIYLENNYGDDTNIKYDMVRKVNIEVKFPVGDSEETVKMSGTKSLELVQLGNKPEIDYEHFEYVAERDLIDFSEIKPIKRSGSGYIVTTEEDKEWYNYESKIWAKAIIANNLTYDSSTGIVKDGFEYFTYVWVPSFGADINNKLKFRYNDTRYSIISKDLEAKAAGDPKRRVFTVDTVSPELQDLNGIKFDLRGYWIKYTELETNPYTKALSDSEYGPMMEL